MSYKPIAAVHKFDKSSPVSLMPKITDVHLSPNPFEKMTVSRAVQVLSNSVASAIKYSLDVRPHIFNNIPRKTVEGTAYGCGKFVFLMQ